MDSDLIEDPISNTGTEMAIDRVEFISAGYYWSDAGAAMGVLPRAIWDKKIQTDDKFRLRMELNCLYFESKDKKFLVDTGIGNRVSEKQKKIYNPSEYMLFYELDKLGINPVDIDIVVLTHLHFDHAGGLIFLNERGEMGLSFPNAEHYIQEREWQTAKYPDELNQAAYNFQENLALLESNGKVQLINGDCQIDENVKIVLTGGHSEGCQILELETEQGLMIYAGDIIPSQMHINLPVISAYDVSRKDTFTAKKRILDVLAENKGTLILNHDECIKSIEFNSTERKNGK